MEAVTRSCLTFSLFQNFSTLAPIRQKVKTFDDNSHNSGGSRLLTKLIFMSLNLTNGIKNVSAVIYPFSPYSHLVNR